MNVEGLRAWQAKHARHLYAVLKSTKSALDGSDTGIGKTYVASAIVRQLGVHPLIICPKATIPAWESVADYFGIGATIANYDAARGRSTKDTDGLSFSELGQEKKWGPGSYWEWQHKWPLIIFDEVDRCSGSTTLNSKMLIAAKRQAGAVFTMSATAAENPLQMKALGYVLGLHNLKKFRDFLLLNACRPGVWGGWTWTKNAEEQRRVMARLHGQIYPAKGSRLKKCDIPGFPKVLETVNLIEDEGVEAAKLSGELAALYAGYREQEAEAETKLEQLTRVRQALEILKVEAMVELAEDYSRSSKVILFTNFKATLAALRTRLAVALKVDTVPAIDGDTPDDLREQYRQEFQAGLHPAIVVNAQAGGAGLSLHSPIAAFDTTEIIPPMYSARVLTQVRGRDHRDGGGFARHILCYFKEGEKAIANTVLRKLENLETLNDGELNGVN